MSRVSLAFILKSPGCKKFIELSKSPNSGLSAQGKTRLDRERAKVCLSEVVSVVVVISCDSCYLPIGICQLSGEHNGRGQEQQEQQEEEHQGQVQVGSRAPRQDDHHGRRRE